MLEIASWSWSNFLSYGDYTSNIDLDGMNQCFITGLVEDEQGNPLDGRSNGAGKSSVIAALQWALFGRTSHSHNPGDKIMNHQTKGETWVKVVLTNGDNILRTRRRDGSCEVTYYHSGLEESIVADTLSTLSAQQARLNQVFKLDWDVFSKSVFFSVFDKSWMSMPDQQRKKVLERLLKLDRFEYYAKSAAGRAGADASGLEVQHKAIKDRLRFLEELKSQVELQIGAVARHEESKARRIEQHQNHIRDLNAKLLNVPVYDYDDIRSQWDQYRSLEKQINEKVVALQHKQSQVYSDINVTKSRINILINEINKWDRAKGQICTSCGQSISDGHVHEQINPKSAELESLKPIVPTKEKEYSDINEMLSKVKLMLESKKPLIQLETVLAYNQQITNINSQIFNSNSLIEQIQSEQPPNNDSIVELRTSMERIGKEIHECKIQSEILENRVLHLEYIRKAYSDRNKIKSYVLANHVPFINERLEYYLDIFGLDVRIRFDNNLTVSSNCWGYDFQSSGERRRTDVAMMLATYDMHEQLYGRQCNILALDEVDGQMDPSGIDSLVHIIKNDLSRRVGTIFVISHRDTMQNVFGSEIKVRKRGSFSYLEK